MKVKAYITDIKPVFEIEFDEDSNYLREYLDDDLFEVKVVLYDSLATQLSLTFKKSEIELMGLGKIIDLEMPESYEKLVNKGQIQILKERIEP